jgi:hypothetical protein
MNPDRVLLAHGVRSEISLTLGSRVGIAESKQENGRTLVAVDEARIGLLVAIIEGHGGRGTLSYWSKSSVLDCVTVG